MASSPSFNSTSLRLDRFSSTVHEENGLVSSNRGFGLCRNPKSLFIHASNGSLEETQKWGGIPRASFVSRSCKGAVISGCAIAATTAFGLSIFLYDGFAIASELDQSSTTIVSVASAHVSPNQRATSTRSPKESGNSKPALDPSINSNLASNLSLNMAIPIPHEQEWIIVRNGHMAPLLHMQRQKSSSLKCPQWTPSEFEMFLPDFNGRPKPFPRQGRHWFASFVIRGRDNEAFLEVADLRQDVENETGALMTASSLKEAKLATQEVEGRLTLLKVLGMERFICFSM